MTAWPWGGALFLAAGVASAEPARAPALLPADPGLDGGEGGHWGKQTERDWRDGRWNEMAHGPFVSTSLALPGGPIAKGLAIRVGDRGETTVAFDRGTLTLAAAWSGGFLRFSPHRFGLLDMPAVAGRIVHVAPERPGWAGAQALRWRGLHLHGRKVLLSYEVDGRAVREVPWASGAGRGLLFSRTLEVGPGARPLALRLAGPRTAVALVGAPAGARLVTDPAGTRLAIGASAEPIRLEVLVGADGVPAARVRAAAAARPAPRPLEALGRGGPRRWGDPIVVRGERAEDRRAYVLDTVPVPHDNRFRALLFLSDIDFFPNGDAAVSAVHGDVWIVRGLDAGLARVSWQRFATGLYQPLGLRVVGGKVHVMGRDQLTVLHDHDGDGEADQYENLNSDVTTSLGGHDFVACLETDAAGNFHYVDPRGLHRISPDGGRHETIATGWRNPNGLSIGPDGTITVAPQEGEWTPASLIDVVRPGGYYGAQGPRPGPGRPEGFDPHLVYLPRAIDNSTGSQLWVTSDRFGPLGGHLLSFSFGQSAMQLVLRHAVDGIAQGAVVPLEARFLSGAMRGRMHPADGQLWVVGMNGWVTNAVKDGSLQRVRYTGQPAPLPVESSVHANGLRIGFSIPLDRAAAEDASRYGVDRWNYRYGKAYGSKEYSVLHPDREGHDPVEVLGAHLLDDGRSVFLALGDMRPVHQLRVKATLTAADGTRFPFTLVQTVNALGPAQPLDRRAPAPVARARDEGPAAPGLMLRLESADGRHADARVSRLAALQVPAGAPASPFLAPGPFRARWQGSIEIAEPDEVTFSIEGRGRARLRVGGQEVLAGDAASLAGRLSLGRGRHALELAYESPDEGEAWIRLFWAGTAFHREPVPPTVLRHAPGDPAVRAADQLRRGRAVVAEAGCLRCHPPAGDVPPEAPPELAATGPSLAGIGDRLEPAWLARWLRDPRAVRPDATMPRLLAGAGAAQDAADLAAYLATLRGPRTTRAAPGDARTGARLFQALRCQGCHADPTGAVASAGDDRVGWGGLAGKYRPGALAAFLRRPAAHAPWTRMPDFRLDAREAGALAAFLAATAEHPRAPRGGGGAAGDPRRGRALADQLGCANCHEIPGVAPRPAAPWPDLRAADWQRAGCVAEGPAGPGVPDLGLAPDETRAVRAFAAGRPEALFRPDGPERASTLVTALRCGGCHDRDGVAARAADAEDRVAGGGEEMAVHRIPGLTFAGEKLRPEWLADLLDGRLARRTRPWMEARMPVFGRRAEGLAAALAREHGLPPRSAPEPPPPAEPVAMGRRLVGSEGGLNCTTCHPIGATARSVAAAPPAIDLAETRRRLTYDYYLRWLLDPLRIDPLTPMPAYADRDGRTVLTEIAGGDGRRQFEAIWHHLATTGR